MPSGQGVTGYRRNGKRQACEPCRKGKLACDHGSPFCGRCVRRKTTKKCLYHPAPMTKARAPMVLSDLHITSDTACSNGSCPSLPSASNQAPLTSPNAASELAPYPGPNPEGGKAGSLTAVAIKRPRNSNESWKDAVYPQSARYYGPTSFSAVFLEHQATASEDLLELGEDVRRHPGAWKFGQPLCMNCFLLSVIPHTSCC
jgi:hypothetical protein